MAALQTLSARRPSMDDDSYRLAMELMLEDAKYISSGAGTKGKQREGDVSDTQLAFRLHAQELEIMATTEADRRLTASLQQAMRTDTDAVRQFQREERMACHDHAVALALAHGREPPPMPSPSPTPEPLPEVEQATPHEAAASDTGTDKPADQPAAKTPELAQPVNTRKHPRAGLAGDHVGRTKRPKSGPATASAAVDKGKGKQPAIVGLATTPVQAGAKAFDFRDETDNDVIFLGKRLKQGESSAWAAARGRPSNQRPCTSCIEDTPEDQLLRTPCGHEYCHACIKSLFTSAMRDETLFPPKCCRQAIPAEEHADILGASLVNLYHAKRIEFSTEDRTYCHNATCGAFINPIDVGRCTQCSKQTCLSCKKASHDGDCPHDVELQRVLELAEQENWRRCDQCNTMVELAHGCNHMTCRCGAQFCYVCGVKWQQDPDEPKACACPLFTEEDLVEVQQRQLERALQNPEVLVRAHLAEEECAHDGQWQRNRTDRRCDVCTVDLPHYVYECLQCDLSVCRRCRFNRL